MSRLIVFEQQIGNSERNSQTMSSMRLFFLSSDRHASQYDVVISEWEDDNSNSSNNLDNFGNYYDSEMTKGEVMDGVAKHKL